MSDLFEKFSTLVNAQLNDLMGKNPASPLARLKLKPDAAKEQPRQSAHSLRHRLEEAISYEDHLEARVDALLKEAAALDAEVDAALAHQDEFGARRLQNQLNMKRQQLAIAESELQDHRLVTRHLLRELNALEAALDQQERPAARASSGPRRQSIPVAGTSGGPAAKPDSLGFIDAMTDKLDEARGGLESLLNNSPVPGPSASDAPRSQFDIIDEAPDPRMPKSRKRDERDMDDRLSRLSKSEDAE